MTTEHLDAQPVADVHAHAVPADWVDELVRGRVRFPHVTVADDGEGAVFAFDGAAPARPVARALSDADARGEWLTAQGIDRQFVGGWVDALGYQLPTDEGADWARLLTEKLVELCARDERLAPLGAVPLQAPERAADELRAALAAGCAGVMIGSQAGALELDHASMTPFWEAADELGAAVFLHPGFHSTGRYAAYALSNGLARLEDSTVTVARLLLAGVPARHPGLKLIIAHGGGAVPYVLGRLARNELVTGRRHADPVESFAHLYFDTVVYDPAALAFLVGKAGADKVLLGSDHPFPMAEPAPRKLVEAAGLDERTTSLLLHGNAERVYGLPSGVRAP